MTAQFDDILKAICTEVNPSHTNDFQKIYTLGTSIEAKLAYDILISFGFEAKAYHTPDKPSKLYITNPKGSPEQISQQLSSALAYAQALKKITLSLDELCQADISISKANGFTVAFVNSHPSGKQILIQISQDVASALTSPAEPASPSVVKSEAPTQAAANKTAGVVKISSSQARVAKKVRKPKNDEDDFASGPTVGRGLYPTKILPEGGTAKHTLRQRILLRMFGNFATSGYATLMWLVVAFAVTSFIVSAKGYYCYDFVTKKSTKWYCQDGSAMSAEEARKLKQQEEQRKLGLQPVAPQ